MTTDQQRAPTVYFELHKVETKHDGLGFATSAIWPCALCTNIIDGMGGPGSGEVCEECAADLKSNRVRGLIRRKP